MDFNFVECEHVDFEFVECGCVDFEFVECVYLGCRCLEWGTGGGGRVEHVCVVYYCV